MTPPRRCGYPTNMVQTVSETSLKYKWYKKTKEFRWSCTVLTGIWGRQPGSSTMKVGRSRRLPRFWPGNWLTGPGVWDGSTLERELSERVRGNGSVTPVTDWGGVWTWRSGERDDTVEKGGRYCDSPLNNLIETVLYPDFRTSSVPTRSPRYPVLVPSSIVVGGPTLLFLSSGNNFRNMELCKTEW